MRVPTEATSEVAMKRPMPGMVRSCVTTRASAATISNYRSTARMRSLDLADLPRRLCERGAEQAGDTGVGIFEERPHLRDDVTRARRDHESELAQETPHSVDPGGARGEPHGAEPMQGGQRLLRLRLHRHRPNVFIAKRLEQPFGVSAIGLVAGHVGTHDVRSYEGVRTGRAGRRW